MTVWTASDDWGGYVAEIGPYVGPWPPAPPIPANLTDDTTLKEVDYVVTTSLLADVLTDSMADGVDVWRRWQGAPGETRANTAIGQAEVTGATLYVVAYLPGFDYPGSGAPSMDAASLVPPLYVTGATGTDVPDPATGGWSAPQPGEVELASAFGSLYGGAYIANAIAAGWVDIQAESDVALGDLRAWPVGIAWSGPSGGTPSAQMFFTGIHEVTGGSNRTQAPTSLSQSAARYETFDPGLVQPAPLFDLVEGLDYTAPPVGTVVPPDSAGAAYFAGPVVFDGWNDDTAASLSIRIGNGLHVSPVPPTPFGTARVAIIDEADVIAGPPYLYTDGTTATEQTKTTTGTTGYTFTAPLSGVSGQSFGLVVLSRFMDSDGSPLNDFTGTGQGDWQVAARLASINATARWQQPDWKYWTFGEEPKWHTVAGSWASISGAPMAIFTPDLGPVEYADGPA